MEIVKDDDRGHFLALRQQEKFVHLGKRGKIAYDYNPVMFTDASGLFTHEMESFPHAPELFSYGSELFPKS